MPMLLYKSVHSLKPQFKSEFLAFLDYILSHCWYLYLGYGPRKLFRLLFFFYHNKISNISQNKKSQKKRNILVTCNDYIAFVIESAGEYLINMTL